MVKEISGPIFLPKLAELLAPMTERQVVYLFRKKEKELGEKIFLGGGKGSPLYVTIPILTRYFPEFVDHRPHLAKLLKEHLFKIDQTQAELKKAVISNRKTINKVISSDTFSRTSSSGHRGHQSGRTSSTSAPKGGGKLGSVSKASNPRRQW